MACLEQERFDLLLLDLKIPDVDGLAVLRRVRELYPDLAAITMASYATLQHAIASLQAGAQDFPLKPFDPDDLLRAVYEALAAQRQEQKALEERVARQQLASMLERISDGLVALDTEWRHTYVNEQAVLMLNRRRPADLIGKNCWEEYPEAAGTPFAQAYRRAPEERQPTVIASGAAAAVTAGDRIMKGNPVAGFHGGDLQAGLLDDDGYLVARRHRQRPNGRCPCPMMRIQLADAGSSHPDQNVLVVDGRDRYSLCLLGLADADQANCFHSTPLANLARGRMRSKIPALEKALTGLVQPHISGKELADQLGSRRPEMRVLYMSGYADAVLQHRVLAGQAAFLSKPFTTEQLVQKVQAVLGGLHVDLGQHRAERAVDR